MPFHWLKACEPCELSAGWFPFYGVSVGVERDIIVVVLHFMLVGCQEILEPVSYRRSDACLG